MESFLQQRKHQTVFFYLCVDIKSFGKVKEFFHQEKIKVWLKSNKKSNN